MKIIKSKTTHATLLLTLYCLLLLMVRIKISNSFFYAFMVWNLFLAYVPFGITMILKQIETVQKSTFKFWSLSFIWILFLPNAPYIITDLVHLNQGIKMPLWFDMLLIISFAINGFLVFFVSVNDMFKIIKNKFSNTFAWIFTSIVFFICSFGIYLGRFLRWNSWDMLQHPISLIQDIFTRIAHPMEHPKTWGITFGFGFLFSISFLIFKTLTTSNENKY